MTTYQSIAFNNSATAKGGVAFTLARSGTAYQEDGTAISSGTPRYADSKVFSAAPSLTDISGFAGSSFRPLASGFDSDDTTPILIARKGVAELQVHARTDPESYWNSSDATGTTITTLGGTNGDLLTGQTGLNGGTAAITNHEFVPKAAYVYHGLIVIECDHFFFTGTAWASEGVALAYTTTDRLANADPWVLLAVTEAVNIGPTSHGQAWSLTGFQVSSTRVALLWTDYGTSTKDGGNANLTVADLSGGTWSFETCRLADDYRTGGTNDEHFHTSGLILDSSGNWQVLISLGDGFQRNRLIHRSLSASDVSAGNFGSGTTYSHATYGATGIAGSYTIQSAHANWSAESVVRGGIVYGSTNRALRHNQVINMIQMDTALSTLLCGTDETSSGIVKCTWDETHSVPIFDIAYLPQVSSSVGDGVVNFVVSGNPGGPFVAKIGGDSWDDIGGSGVADLEACVVYSADGVAWSQIVDWQQAAQYAAVPHAGKVYLGAQSSGTPKYLSPPTSNAARPLQIASESANAISASVSGAGVSTNVTVTQLASDLSDLPTGVPAPPCVRDRMFFVHSTQDASASNQYGNWDLATGLSSTASTIQMQAWVYALPYDGASHDNKSSAAIWMRFQQVSGGSGTFSLGRTVFDTGKWVPITAFAEMSSFSSAPTGPWTLRVQARANGLSTDTTPCQFIICWCAVETDASIYASNGGTGLSEVATASGWTKQSTWSLYAEMMIAEDQWDNRTGGLISAAGTPVTYNPSLFKAFDSIGTDTLEVKADLSGNRVVIASNAASTSGTANKKWWRRGDTFACVITCDGANTKLYYETTDGTIETVTLLDAVQFDEIENVDPVLWRKFITKDEVDADPTATLKNGAAAWNAVSIFGTRTLMSRKRYTLDENNYLPIK